MIKTILLILILGFSWTNSISAKSIFLPKYDHNQLQQEYLVFHKSLDVLQVVKDYPRAVELLLSPDFNDRNRALRMLGESEDINVIPWLLPHILQRNVYAGQALDKLISKQVLKRRDMNSLGTINIKPISQEDIDLRPVAWIIYKMIRLGDSGSLSSYAANMIGYLNLQYFDDELNQMLYSVHPATINSARNALKMLKQHE